MLCYVNQSYLQVCLQKSIFAHHWFKAEHTSVMLGQCWRGAVLLTWPFYVQLRTSRPGIYSAAVLSRLNVHSASRLQRSWFLSANTRRWSNVALILGRRLRRWPNIKPTLDHHIVYTVTWRWRNAENLRIYTVYPWVCPPPLPASQTPG